MLNYRGVLISLEPCFAKPAYLVCSQSTEEALKL